MIIVYESEKYQCHTYSCDNQVSPPGWNLFDTFREHDAKMQLRRT